MKRMNIQHSTFNIQRPTGGRSVVRSALGVECWALHVSAIGILWLAFFCSAAAQTTNAPSSLDYSSFRIISDRNIFNPNRTGRFRSSRSNESQRTRTDSFSLVGTMSYRKGTFAFFDGTSSDYKKVAEAADIIAGYQVTEITPKSVKLEAAGKQIELPIGGQMRREEGGQWQLSAQNDLTPAPAETEAPASEAAASDNSEIEMSDVLKKMAERKKQEQ